MSVNLTKTNSLTANLIASIDKIAYNSDYSLKVEPNKIILSNITLTNPYTTDDICHLIDKCTLDVLNREFMFTYSVISAGTIVFYDFK